MTISAKMTVELSVERGNLDFSVRAWQSRVDRSNDYFGVESKHWPLRITEDNYRNDAPG